MLSCLVEVAGCFCFATWPSACELLVAFEFCGGGWSAARESFPFLAARAALASSSFSGELSRVVFLGGIVGIVFIAEMVGAKCWALTHAHMLSGGPKHSETWGTAQVHDKTNVRKLYLLVLRVPSRYRMRAFIGPSGGRWSNVWSYPRLPTISRGYSM